MTFSSTVRNAKLAVIRAKCREHFKAEPAASSIFIKDDETNVQNFIQKMLFINKVMFFLLGFKRMECRFKIFGHGVATIAQWNYQRLPSCAPWFESQGQHLPFFDLYCSNFFFIILIGM